MIDRAGRILTGFCGIGLLWVGIRFLDAPHSLTLWVLVGILLLIGILLILFALRGERPADKPW